MNICVWFMSLFEFLVVIIVGILVIKPEDLPKIIAKLKEINDWENIYGALKALINIYKQFHSFEDIKIIIEMLIKSQNINNESKISILEELTQYYLTQRKYGPCLHQNPKDLTLYLVEAPRLPFQ